MLELITNFEYIFDTTSIVLVAINTLDVDSVANAILKKLERDGY